MAQRSSFQELTLSKWDTFQSKEGTIRLRQRQSMALEMLGDSMGMRSWKWPGVILSKRQRGNWKIRHSKVRESTSMKSTRYRLLGDLYLLFIYSWIYVCLLINWKHWFDSRSIYLINRFRYYKQQLKIIIVTFILEPESFPQKCSKKASSFISNPFTNFPNANSSSLNPSPHKRSISIFLSKAANTSSSSPNSPKPTKSINIKYQLLLLYLKSLVFTSSPKICLISINAKSSKQSVAKSNNNSKNLSETAKPLNNSSIWTVKSTLKSERNSVSSESYKKNINITCSLSLTSKNLAKKPKNSTSKKASKFNVWAG